MKPLNLLLLLFLTIPAFANSVVFGPPLSGTATITSTQILPANGLRAYFILVNTGSATVYVKFGSAQSGHEGIPIPPGGNYEPYALAPGNSVWVDTASGTSTIVFMEGQ